MIEKKICTKCGTELELINFRKDKSKKDGYYSSCNNCHRIKTGAIKQDKSQGQKCYYEGYRKYILERDGNACVISGITTGLHIHHIKTRGAGGDNEYCNLITLSGDVHRDKAHGKELGKYRDIFLEYTSKFERPDFWDEIIHNSMQNEKQIKKNRNKRNGKYMKKNYQKVKIYRKKVIDKFKLENNGLSPWQVAYRKKKGLL